MRKLLLILFTATLFSSCSNDPSIQGVWRLSHESGEEFPNPFDSRLMDISSDSIHFIHYDFNTGAPFVLTDTSVSSYTRSGSILTISDKGESAGINIEVFTDSLIWSFVDSRISKRKFVYKKLISNSSNRVEVGAFTGKSFTLESRNYQDSVYFVNESKLIHTGEYNFNYPVTNWKLVSYKDFDFLMVQDTFWNMKKINTSSTGEITLADNPGSKNVLRLTETKGALTKNNFEGSWEEAFINNPRPYFADGNPNAIAEGAVLNFSQDSMIIEYRGKSFSRNWELTTDSKRVYFPNHLSRSGEMWWFQNGSWKIIDKTENELTISVYTSYTVESDTVILKRVQPVI